MKEEKKNAGTPGSDGWVIVHEPNIPWGAAGSEDELGVAFGALCCVLVEEAESQGESSTVLGVASEHGLDAHTDALDTLDGAPAVAVR